MHGKSMGPAETVLLLPSNEHSHVGTSHHVDSSSITEELGLSGDTLHLQDTYVWRHRNWGYGRSGNHSPDCLVVVKEYTIVVLYINVPM